ncbi:MAG: GntR family transcriptional regulator, partial [Alphaproteobacteria bacterium]|nr:GntR family transcriptional regulator [Alphaproteobacteria bacterium]
MQSAQATQKNGLGTGGGVTLDFVAVAPLRQSKLADQLYEQIMLQIVNGSLAIGEKLPSEAQLCQLFAVSRPVVREALARLRADNVIASRRGSGTYVQSRPAADLVRLAPSGVLAELLRCYEMRVALEGEAAYLAATPLPVDARDEAREWRLWWEETDAADRPAMEAERVAQLERATARDRHLAEHVTDFDALGS